MFQGLRLFVAEAFHWTHKTGAKKFIRGMAPAILNHKLRTRSHRIRLRIWRCHPDSYERDGIGSSYLREEKSFQYRWNPQIEGSLPPGRGYGIDLDAEEDDSGDYGRDGLAPVNDDDQIEEYVSDDGASRSRSNKPSDDLPPCTIPHDQIRQVPETIAKVGIPLKVGDYEESLRDRRKFIRAKAAAKKAATKGGMTTGHGSICKDHETCR